MKILDIAIKDIKHSFRSAFAIVFMFVIPMLIPIMFYFMVGNTQKDDQAFDLPVTKVIVVNLDQGSPEFEQTMANIPEGQRVKSLGELVTNTLQGEGFTELLEVSLEADPVVARNAVDTQQAAVAIILPADLSTRYVSSEDPVVIEFYQDPTLTVGPGIVESILNQFLDELSGTKILASMAHAESDGFDPAFTQEAVGQYLANKHYGEKRPALLDIRSPQPVEQTANPRLIIFSMIMGAMMVFYAYYTGTSSAHSILQEDEQRTLPRLFTTPTSPTAILTGKFLAVFLTVTIQIIVLLIAAHFMFKVSWGNWESVFLMCLSTILSASAFGICLNSFLKSSKQAGAVFGGVLTITSWVGLMPIFTGFGGATKPMVHTLSLIMPQGWITKMLLGGMNHIPISEIMVASLVSLAWTILLIVIGIWRFHNRYAREK